MEIGGEGTKREGSDQGVGLEWMRGFVRQGNERAFQARGFCRQRLRSSTGTHGILIALLLGAHPVAGIDFVCILTFSTHNSPFSPDKETGV